MLSDMMFLGSSRNPIFFAIFRKFCKIIYRKTGKTEKNSPFL
jgi:hypothetical protein